MTRQRRRFTSEEKAAIVRRHLVDKVPVSDPCDELGLQPTQIYTWQKQLFENAALVFERPGGKAKQTDGKDRKIEALEVKLRQKNEVVSELLEEHVSTSISCVCSRIDLRFQRSITPASRRTR